MLNGQQACYTQRTGLATCKTCGMLTALTRLGWHAPGHKTQTCLWRPCPEPTTQSLHQLRIALQGSGPCCCPAMGHPLLGDHHQQSRCCRSCCSCCCWWQRLGSGWSCTWFAQTAHMHISEPSVQELACALVHAST